MPMTEADFMAALDYHPSAETDPTRSDDLRTAVRAGVNKNRIAEMLEDSTHEERVAEIDAARERDDRIDAVVEVGMAVRTAVRLGITDLEIMRAVVEALSAAR